MDTTALAPTEAAVPSQPDIPAIATAVPPGTNPLPPKPTKSVSKLYYITDASGLYAGGTAMDFRTLEEVRKFSKALPPGEYTLHAKFAKKIIVSDVRRIKGV